MIESSGSTTRVKSAERPELDAVTRWIEREGKRGRSTDSVVRASGREIGGSFLMTVSGLLHEKNLELGLRPHLLKNFAGIDTFDVRRPAHRAKRQQQSYQAHCKPYNLFGETETRDGTLSISVEP